MAVASLIKDFSAKHIARVCGVDIRTARRWRSRTQCPPPWVIALLTADLGIFGPYWAGWVIRGEEIVSPDGWRIRRNDALAVPFMHGQISALRNDLKKAREEIESAKFGAFLEEQPLPDKWSAEGF